MSDLSSRYPAFKVDLSDPIRAINELIRILEVWRDRIVTVVESKQDENEELDIKVYNQNDEPTLSAAENAAFWIDADGGPAYYLVFKHSSGQVKVALT